MDEIAEQDDVSDSGVMSLSPCEDFYSESDLLDIKLVSDKVRFCSCLHIFWRFKLKKALRVE